jgi:hypothetical protein
MAQCNANEIQYYERNTRRNWPSCDLEEREITGTDGPYVRQHAASSVVVSPRPATRPRPQGTPATGPLAQAGACGAAYLQYRTAHASDRTSTHVRMAGL